MIFFDDMQINLIKTFWLQADRLNNINKLHKRSYDIYLSSFINRTPYWDEIIRKY